MASLSSMANAFSVSPAITGCLWQNKQLHSARQLPSQSIVSVAIRQAGLSWGRRLESPPLNTLRYGKARRGVTVAMQAQPNEVLQTALDVKEVLNAESLFNFANNGVIPFWLPMIFAPNWSGTKKLMTSPYIYGVFAVLAASYGYLVILSTQDPAILEGFSGAATLSSISGAFKFPLTVAIGWTHFVAMDLFVGRWVYLDGLRNRVFTSHSLLLNLFFGPLGLASHLLTRSLTVALRDEKLVDSLTEGLLTKREENSTVEDREGS